MMKIVSIFGARGAGGEVGAAVVKGALAVGVALLAAATDSPPPPPPLLLPQPTRTRRHTNVTAEDAEDDQRDAEGSLLHDQLSASPLRHHLCDLCVKSNLSLTGP